MFFAVGRSRMRTYYVNAVSFAGIDLWSGPAVGTVEAVLAISSAVGMN